MSIGVLDDIAFEVTGGRVRTWQEAGRSGEARWVEHEVYAGMPVSEFLGPGVDQIRMSVRFDIERGVVPRDEIRKLREKRDTGAVMQFTIGGNLVGDFTLRGIDEEWRRWSPKGVLMVAQVALTMRQYA
jgi:phage protein U